MQGTVSDIFPNLEELYVFDRECCNPHGIFQISGLTRLRRFGMLEVPMIYWPTMPESLEHFSFSRSRVLYMEPRDDPLSELPNLRSVVLHNFAVPHFRNLEYILSRPATSLWTYLDLERIKELSGDVIRDLMLSGNFRSLSYLNISRIAEVDDRLTPVMIEQMPNLEVLDISFSSITGITIRRLVDSELNIKKIGARHLDTPLSRDAIDYAEKRGVQIGWSNELAARDESRR